MTPDEYRELQDAHTQDMEAFDAALEQQRRAERLSAMFITAATLDQLTVYRPQDWEAQN